MKIRSKKELEFVIQADYMMNRGKFFPSFYERIKSVIFPDYIMDYLKSMRKASYYKGKGKNLFYKWNNYKFRKLGIKLGFSIGHDNFGYGVVIPHYGTIVVGSSNQIGNYAVLHTSTCISDNGKQIGDGLYLATGAIITSKVVLGNNITIGANSLVNKSFVEGNALLVGSPAKFIRDEDAWYIRNNFGRRVEEVEKLKRKYGL